MSKPTTKPVAKVSAAARPLARAASRPNPRETQVSTGLRGAHNTGARAGVDANTRDGREHFQLPTVAEVHVPALNPAHLTPPSEVRSEYHFRAKGLNHRVLIGNEPDTPLGGGRFRPGRTIYAQFKQGAYSTRDKHIAQVLLDNPNCQVGGDYWDAEAEDHEIAKAQLSGFEAALEQNPELLKTFLERVQAGTFDHVLAEAEAQDAAREAADEADGTEGDETVDEEDNRGLDENGQPIPHTPPVE